MLCNKNYCTYSSLSRIQLLSTCVENISCLFLKSYVHMYMHGLCTDFQDLCSFIIDNITFSIVLAHLRLEYAVVGQTIQPVSNYIHVNDTSNLTVFCLGSGNLQWKPILRGSVSSNMQDNPSQGAINSMNRSLSFSLWTSQFNGIYICSSDMDHATVGISLFNSKNYLL